MMAQEKQFENRIKAFLVSEGAWYIKFYANAYTRVGVPDILACVNGHFVGVEVKAQTGHPSKLQLYQCAGIRASGGFAFVLYPSGFEEFKAFIKDLKIDKYDKERSVIMK